MATMDLRADGAGVYVVEVTAEDQDGPSSPDGPSSTESPDHADGPGATSRQLRVVVPPQLLEEMGLTATEEPALVRDALGILVRSGAWQRLPDTFAVPDGEQVLPGFLAELRGSSAR